MKNWGMNTELGRTRHCEEQVDEAISSRSDKIIRHQLLEIGVSSVAYLLHCVREDESPAEPW